MPSVVEVILSGLAGFHFVVTLTDDHIRVIGTDHGVITTEGCGLLILRLQDDVVTFLEPWSELLQPPWYWHVVDTNFHLLPSTGRWDRNGVYLIRLA